MDHYIVGKLLDEEEVNIFDVQTAGEENYPDFEDEEFDVTKGQGQWTNAELLDECCLSLVTKGGVVAKQCKSIDPTLGSRRDKFLPIQKFWES